MTTSSPPATTTHAVTGSHPKTAAVKKKHHHKHAAKHAKQAAVTPAGDLTDTAQSGPISTVAKNSSSTGVPRIAIFASVAAGSLVLLAAIALVVSMVMSRSRPDQKPGGGNILIR